MNAALDHGNREPQVKVPFVDLRAQYLSIKEEIDEAIDQVLETTAFIGGRFVKSFEEAFAHYCGASFCVGVGNGTDALYLTLRALGIGQGDEVVTAANSFIATSEAITMTGARVAFVDCDPHTYTIDTEKLARAISPKTRAIVPVHLYGRPADMTSIMTIARRHRLYVIEDAAQAHGAEIDGRRAGTLGDAACFSFYPGKNLGAYGDGGAIVTNCEGLAEKCRMLANHGRKKKYEHDFEGVNSRLDGLQAAILSVKLRHIEQWTESRRTLAAQYRDLLAGSQARTSLETADVRQTYHLFVVRVESRAKIQSGLRDAGIMTGVHYPVALPNQPAYRYLGYHPQDFPVSTAYSGEILSLPMYPELSRAQVEYVCKHLITLTQGDRND
ncbi:MAG: DegT/DnrJ/EryC1/StrS family aminotransferase [Syntrophobacteraceae bacterium]